MIIREYRIVMPFTLEQFQIGQLYATGEASKNETGGGEGVEIYKNEPFYDFPLLGDDYDSGQYTHKIFKMDSKVPYIARLFLPGGAFEFHEVSWNAFPYCRTIITNPGYMKEHFVIKVETMCVADRGREENCHQLPPDVLKKREIFHINIADARPGDSDYRADEDPKLIRGIKKEIGPLSDVAGWRSEVKPVMCCYKLVTMEIKWWGLQQKLESYAIAAQSRVFARFHRQIYACQDKWMDMTMDDIRKYEEQVQGQLPQMIQDGQVRGDFAQVMDDSAAPSKQTVQTYRTDLPSSTDISGSSTSIGTDSKSKTSGSTPKGKATVPVKKEEKKEESKGLFGCCSLCSTDGDEDKAKKSPSGTRTLTKPEVGSPNSTATNVSTLPAASNSET